MQVDNLQYYTRKYRPYINVSFKEISGFYYNKTAGSLYVDVPCLRRIYWTYTRKYRPCINVSFNEISGSSLQ
jgi:hypothetical protein